MTLRALRAIPPHCKSSIYGFCCMEGATSNSPPLQVLNLWVLLYGERYEQCIAPIASSPLFFFWDCIRSTFSRSVLLRLLYKQQSTKTPFLVLCLVAPSSW
ncbi:hypothetical protein K501DRAFT_45647 [Backusella circina FSU 941]|nr:hypothetical protein K501DRAFT_45647 [Backusella circina FSU 941]